MAVVPPVPAPSSASSRPEDQLISVLGELRDIQAALDEHSIVAITDASGKITSVNDKFCALSKYSREELLGQDHRIINSGHHPKAFFAELWRTIARGKVWRGEVLNRAKDGSLYWVDTTVFPRLGENGKPVQYVAIRTDITERKANEEKLRQAAQDLGDRNKELEMIVYTISHDLRSPLVNIQGFSRQLERACSAVERAVLAAREAEDGKIPAAVLEKAAKTTIPQALHFINAGARKIDVVLSGILRYSRLGRATIQIDRLDMNVVISEIASAIQFQLDECKARIELLPLPPCLGDRSNTSQVFGNLLDNALKYRAAERPLRIVVGGREEDGKALYWVSDSGLGIAPEHQTKIFEIFHRLNPEAVGGEGLGLTIAQRMLEKQGGKIWVESREGVGTTFFVSLPAIAPARARAAEDEEEDPGS
ncbi:MAG TPA: ATP-binding protein [Candidatus Methylacidiphilales bacterium]